MGRGRKGGAEDGRMGRSSGGLTTKIHALVDAEGRPLCLRFCLRLSAGQAADCREAEAPLKPVQKGAILLADKAYDTNAIRVMVCERGAWPKIPPKTNRKQGVAFSSWLYRRRNLVERFFNRIKQFRGLAILYDKDPENFLEAIKILSAKISMRAL